MAVSVLAVAVVAAVAVLAASRGAVATGGDGWNAQIDWVTDLDTAVSRSAETGKPIMTLVHKAWCGACKNLRPQFANSAEIEKLSANFVMFDAGDDREPSGDAWAPQGGYIPRILFSRPGAKTPLADYINPARKSMSNDKYQHFYTSENEVVLGMKAAMDLSKDEL